MTEPLLPCPFCGLPADLRSGRDPAQVGCFNQSCGIRPKAQSTCSSTAIRKWNQRATFTPPTAAEPREWNENPGGLIE